MAFDLPDIMVDIDDTLLKVEAAAEYYRLFAVIVSNEIMFNGRKKERWTSPDTYHIIRDCLSRIVEVIQPVHAKRREVASLYLLRHTRTARDSFINDPFPAIPGNVDYLDTDKLAHKPLRWRCYTIYKFTTDLLENIFDQGRFKELFHSSWADSREGDSVINQYKVANIRMNSPQQLISKAVTNDNDDFGQGVAIMISLANSYYMDL